MKRLILSVVMVLLLAPCSYAIIGAKSHGSAVTTTFEYRYSGSTRFDMVGIDLSNITSSEITCTVRVYDHDGNEIIANLLQFVATGNYAAGSEARASNEPTFTIPAHGSRSVHLYKAVPQMVYGYAVIEWESDDVDLVKAMVGTVVNRGIIWTSGRDSSAVPINSGQPF